MEFFEPWYTPKDLGRLEAQLASEVPAGHVLSGISVRALAQRQDCDDVLFQLLDGSSRVAVVHLTYSANPTANCPTTKFFPGISEWVRDCMLPAHSEFNA